MTMVKPKKQASRRPKTAQEETLEEKALEKDRDQVNQSPAKTDKTKITNVPDEDALDEADQDSVDPD